MNHVEEKASFYNRGETSWQCPHCQATGQSAIGRCFICKGRKYIYAKNAMEAQNLIKRRMTQLRNVIRAEISIMETED